jgi:ribosomal 30S subunit maturation factor RimM
VKERDVPPTAVRLGRLGRTFQLEGALRCRPAGPGAAEALLRLGRLWVAGHGRLVVRSSARHGDAVLLAFQGVRSPERAQPLVNAEVFADPDDLAAATDGPLASSLVGVPVEVDGEPYGHVVDIIQAPQLLLVVEGPDGERLLPGEAPYVQITPELVRVVDPPAGLLDEA